MTIAFFCNSHFVQNTDGVKSWNKKEMSFMAKTIKDENGNTYVQKKPLYKKLWFWIVVVFAVFIVGGVFGGDSDDTSSGSSSSSKTEQTSKSSSSSTSEKSSSTSESSSSESVSAEFRSALRAAQTYSDTMHMSKKGLYDQLTSEDGEKFPADAAQYAVDHVKADWNKNALETAKTYQEEMDMSTEAIRDQLASADGEQFTQEEADYAVQHLNK